MDIDRMVDCTTDYIILSRDIVVPDRTVRFYSNNKPWITSDIKALFYQTNKALRKGDREKLRCVQHQLKRRLMQEKEE